jgi:hypothetical protein
MSAMLRTSLRVLTVGLVLATVALFAAPAGALTDAEEWSDTFCTETGGWLSGAQAGAEELSAQAEDPSLTPADGKALIVDYVSTGADATKAFGQAMKRAGVPDVKNGARIQAAILAGIAGSEAKLIALEKAAKTLPTKSPTAFQKGAEKLAKGLSSFSEPFQKGLSKAESLDTSGELDAALSAQASCADLEQFVTGG